MGGWQDFPNMTKPSLSVSLCVPASIFTKKSYITYIDSRAKSNTLIDNMTKWDDIKDQGWF